MRQAEIDAVLCPIGHLYFTDFLIIQCQSFVESLLLLCACAAPEQADALPQELVGSWVSAGNGDLIETMTLAQDGTISVQCTFRGKDTGTIRGVWHADGQTLFTDIQEGTSPYQAEFIWTVDGRELTLTDDSGTARYVRND